MGFSGGVKNPNDPLGQESAPPRISNFLHDLKYLVLNFLESVTQNTSFSKQQILASTVMGGWNLASPPIPGFVGTHPKTWRPYSNCRHKVF